MNQKHAKFFHSLDSLEHEQQFIPLSSQMFIRSLSKRHGNAINFILKKPLLSHRVDKIIKHPQ